MRPMSRLSLAVATILSLVGTGLTWSIYRAEVAGQQAAFDMLAQRAARRVEIRIEQHIALLTATRAFLEVHHDPRDREVFAAFVSGLDLDENYAGLQGIGLSQLLTPGSEAAVEASLSKNYGASVEVWPAPFPGLRTAVTLLEPNNARNRAALGFDMSTEERRRTAMLQALERGAPAATAPVELVQEITEDVQAGILIYTPLRSSADPSLDGFVYAPLRMGDLFAAALAGGGDLPLEIRAVDAEAPDLPLFESPGYPAAAAAEAFSSETTLQIVGRDWILSAEAGPNFDSADPLRHTMLTGIIFALLVLTTTYAVHWQSLAIDRTRVLGDIARRSAEQKDLLMREMVHRLKNVLARVSGIARQTAREAADKNEMAARLDARLRAMAAAQDLLVRSDTEAADLEELLHSEIDQISGASVKLSGPSVQLDAQQTHALALVFHELATNALKYGAAAQDLGQLDIAWSVERKPTGDELRILWQESMSALARQVPGPGTGFGSRLLAILVEGELRGRLERHLQTDGLTLDICFPLTPKPPPTSGS